MSYVQRLFTIGHPKTKNVFHTHNTAMYGNICYVKMGRKRFRTAFIFSTVAPFTNMDYL